MDLLIDGALVRTSSSSGSGGVHIGDVIACEGRRARIEGGFDSARAVVLVLGGQSEHLHFSLSLSSPGSSGKGGGGGRGQWRWRDRVLHTLNDDGSEPLSQVDFVEAKRRMTALEAMKQRAPSPAQRQRFQASSHHAAVRHGDLTCIF